jgi:hypothetical protein
MSFDVNTLFDVLIDTRAVRMFTVENKQWSGASKRAKYSNRLREDQLPPGLPEFSDPLIKEVIIMTQSTNLINSTARQFRLNQPSSRSSLNLIYTS